MADEQELPVTTRGLTSSDFQGTPLRHFMGTLDEIVKEPGKFKERFNINFSGIDVIESTEPYPYATATISIPGSNRWSSRWGIFAKSVNAIIPETEDILDQTGKRFEMKLTPNHMLYDGKEQKELPKECWEVVSIDGVSAETAAVPLNELLEEELNGKTLPEFNKAVFANPAVRNDKDLMKSLQDGSFVKGLVDSGRYSKDENNIYRKVS
jgi:hypothetical protein